MRVFVYWNLHRKLWSVKALEGPSKGRVIDRTDTVLLADVTGKVSEAGRLRVIAEDRKNVHAGLVGTRVDDSINADSRRGNKIDILVLPKQIKSVGDTITYNPRKYTSFVHTVDGSKFEGSAYALLTANRSVFVV